MKTLLSNSLLVQLFQLSTQGMNLFGKSIITGLLAIVLVASSVAVYKAFIEDKPTQEITFYKKY